MDGPVRAAGRRPATLLALLVSAGLGSLGWLAVLPAPAGAAERPCVGVVIDARLLGGEVRTGCADGDPDSGLDAITMAGFRYAFVPRQPGQVCQLDEAPECSRTGTTTYWSYWHRAKDSLPWVYSSVGAGTHDPAPGSTEAWVWQDGGRRRPPDVSLTSICPQRSAAPRSTPATSKTPATTGPSGATRPTTAPTSSPPANPPSPSDPPTSRSTEVAPADGSAAGAGPDEAPWAGLMLGGGLVAALGAAALARARRSGGNP